MTNWQNLPDKSTPISQTNLRHIEQGVKNVTDFINTLDATSGLYLCQTPFTTELKNKLDGIEAQANKYTLPTASQSVLGGVKVDGVTITISNGVISAAAATIPNLSQLSDVDIDSLSNGQILKWDATNLKWINANESGGTTIDELNDIGDVDIKNPSNGQGLIYDADNDKWINGNVASAMASLTDVVLTGLSDGQTLIWDSETSKWVNSDIEIPDVLDYDETLNVLGDAESTVPSIPIMYSTEERLVGKWIDDSDLYQITVATGESVPTGGTLIQRTAQTGYDTLLYTKTSNNP
jgi:hypothetical protein